MLPRLKVRKVPVVIIDLKQSNSTAAFRESLVLFSKWFEPRTITCSYGVIVRVKVALKRSVVGVDHTIRTTWCFW